MTHPLHEAFARALAEKVDARSIVVVYDPSGEFASFFEDELGIDAESDSDIRVTNVGGRKAFVTAANGGLVALRQRVERLVQDDDPPALIVYLPGVTRDTRNLPLAELDLGGTAFEPQLRAFVRPILEAARPQDEVDQLMQNETISYSDCVALISQLTPAAPSLLKVIIPGASEAERLAAWLTDPQLDDEIDSRHATPELISFLAGHLGIELAADAHDLAEVRRAVERFMLLTEFTEDLDGEPPAVMASMRLADSREQIQAVCAATATLRAKNSEWYEVVADRVQDEYELHAQAIDAARLGSIDTFRFEEKALLRHVVALLDAGESREAREIVKNRISSFWLTADPERRVLWDAVDAMAALAREIDSVAADLDAMPSGSASEWVRAYARPDGWQSLDSAYRGMELRIHGVADSSDVDDLLRRIRSRYDELTHRLALGFTEALVESAWDLPGVLSQADVFARKVKSGRGRRAYVLVDALRFEMGSELVATLEPMSAVAEAAIEPAFASLPSITPVGMAALLPGAESSFSVVQGVGATPLAAVIQGSSLSTRSDRIAHFKAALPGMVEITLDQLLALPAAELEDAADASLLLVTSQEIDAAGEVGAAASRAAMASTLQTLRRAVTKLAEIGIRDVVITADHGHLFGSARDDSMKVDPPTGQQVDLHRRVWAGRGGDTPAGTVRVRGVELGYDTDLDFVFPRGAGVFRSGGDLAYHHGGPSLQESVVPVLVLTLAIPHDQQAVGTTVTLAGLSERVTSRVFSVSVTLEPSLLDSDPRKVRVIGTHGDTVVAERLGLAGEPESVELIPGVPVQVFLQVTDDSAPELVVTVLDASTDAVLHQSPAMLTDLLG